MKYLDCPKCGAPEAIGLQLEPEDFEVGVGSYPEIVSVSCGCEPVSAEHAEQLEAEADRLWPEAGDWVEEPADWD